MENIASYESRLVGNGQLSADALRFLSMENRERVHVGIVNAVYEKTDQKIALGRQSDMQLYAMMIQVLNRYPTADFKTLNTVLLNDCVMNVLSNVSAHLQYTRDILSQDGSLYGEVVVPALTRTSR